MNIIRRIALLIGIALIHIFPAFAQEQECLEIWNYWSDTTRHEVNLDTGSVTTYDSPYASGSTADYWHSPDRRYNYNLEPYGNNTLQRLTLTDNLTGISITLSENVHSSVYWSADSQWLAYAERFIDHDTPSLILTVYHTWTAEFITAPIVSGELATMMGFAWSVDASQLALTVVADAARSSQLYIYSVPELTVIQSYELMWSPSITTLNWSASERYLAVTGLTSEVGIIDTTIGQVHTVTLDGFANFHFQWSPDETYLMVYFTQNDFSDSYNFIDTQGNIVFENLLATKMVDWVSGYEVIAQAWTDTGRDELVLLNLQAGERSRMMSDIGHYAVSPDKRYVATQRLNLLNPHNAPRVIHFFDLTQQHERPVFRLTLATGYDNFIWRTTGLELIVLFDDRSLQAYHYETRTRRSIATIVGDEQMMQYIRCRHS